MFDIRSVFTLLAHQAEVRRICELAAPVSAEARKVTPEIMPLLRNLGIALGLLDTTQRPTKALAYFDTRWLQEALKQLGSPDLLVDGEYSDATKARSSGSRSPILPSRSTAGPACRPAPPSRSNSKN